MARICLILTAQWKSRKGNTYAGSLIALANPYAVNLNGCLTWRVVALGETVALPINSLPNGAVTFSLSEPCANLIYNGELTLRGL